MAKRSAEQVLKALDAWDADDAIDAEMQRVLEMTPEERENELRAAGLDVEAEREKAAASLEALTGDAAADSHADGPPAEPAAWVTRAAPPRRATPAARWVMLLAAALGAAATGGGVLYAVAHRPKPNDKSVEMPREVPTAGPPPAPPPPQETQSASPPAPPPRDKQHAPRGEPQKRPAPAPDNTPRDIK